MLKIYDLPNGSQGKKYVKFLFNKMFFMFSFFTITTAALQNSVFILFKSSCHTI